MANDQAETTKAEFSVLKAPRAGPFMRGAATAEYRPVLHRPDQQL